MGLTDYILKRVNTCNFRNETPLYLAVRKGLLSLVDELIKNNADVNALNDVYERNDTIRKYLKDIIDAKLPIDQSKLCHYISVRMHTSWSLAVEKEEVDILKLLLATKKIKDINRIFFSESSRGETSVLGIAVVKRNIEMIKELLEYPNIDINIGILQAMQDKNTDILQFLFKNIKSTHTINSKDILHYAVLSAISFRTLNGISMKVDGNKRYIDIVTTLLNNRIDINASDEDGLTALHLLCSRKILYDEVDYNIAGILLNNPSIDVNIEDSKRFTALDYALENNHFELIKKLIQKGAKIKTDALYIAAKKGSIEAVEAIIPFINEETLNFAHNSDGKTALINAAENGYTDIVDELLNVRNIDINKIDKSNYSALKYLELNRNKINFEVIKNLFYSVLSLVAFGVCCVGFMAIPNLSIVYTTLITLRIGVALVCGASLLLTGYFTKRKRKYYLTRDNIDDSLLKYERKMERIRLSENHLRTSIVPSFAVLTSPVLAKTNLIPPPRKVITDTDKGIINIGVTCLSINGGNLIETKVS